MKIIFSRKGFDSSTGKFASPIFPSGELCSLPIPETLAGKDLLECDDYPEAIAWLANLIIN